VIGMYASVAALIWRIRRHPSLFLVAPGVLAFMAANLVDWPWHLAASGAIWALGMGACLALQAAPNPRRSSPAPVHAGQA
jgi:protein-S-isoprenylcysteine O-methyltransferase Ste14